MASKSHRRERDEANSSRRRDGMVKFGLAFAQVLNSPELAFEYGGIFRIGVGPWICCFGGRSG